MKDYKAKIRQEVFQKYGGKCTCCGESEWAFLCIDHVDNDGAEARRNGEGGSHTLRLKLAAKECDPRYQLLCYNCNWSKHQNGGICIHESQRLLYGGVGGHLLD